MAVSDGNTNLGVVNLNLGRIYERLRKRSYRSQGNDAHRFYVEGVRDALNAVKGGVGT